MVFFEEIQIELFEHFRQAFVKPHFGAELFELLIGGPIHREVVEQALHVSEFVVVPFRSGPRSAQRSQNFSALIPKAGKITSSCM